MTEKLDVSEIIDIAQDAVQPTQVAVTADNLLFIPGSVNRSPQVLDIDQIRQPPVPRRKSGHITVYDIGSLNRFIFHNKDAGNITVYVNSNPLAPSIVAILNDHGDAGAGHRDLRATVQFRETPEWTKWRSIDGKLLPQADFAEFIEENLQDILEPAGARMLEIATYLSATRSVDFKSAVNLSNGNVALMNIESIDAKVGPGQIDVPAEFTLQIAPIQGSPRFKIPTRFRYRLLEGKLRLGFKLLRLEDVMTDVLNTAISDIAQGGDGEDANAPGRVILLEGKPTAPNGAN
jgi:uncharacterized protein YfdQ (DUF2303 family)